MKRIFKGVSIQRIVWLVSFFIILNLMVLAPTTVEDVGQINWFGKALLHLSPILLFPWYFTNSVPMLLVGVLVNSFFWAVIFERAIFFISRRLTRYSYLRTPTTAVTLSIFLLPVPHGKQKAPHTQGSVIFGVVCGLWTVDCCLLNTCNAPA
jgi:hypothetical protein